VANKFGLRWGGGVYCQAVTTLTGAHLQKNPSCMPKKSWSEEGSTSSGQPFSIVGNTPYSWRGEHWMPSVESSNLPSDRHSALQKPSAKDVTVVKLTPLSTPRRQNHSNVIVTPRPAIPILQRDPRQTQRKYLPPTPKQPLFPAEKEMRKEIEKEKEKKVAITVEKEEQCENASGNLARRMLGYENIAASMQDLAAITPRMYTEDVHHYHLNIMAEEQDQDGGNSPMLKLNRTEGEAVVDATDNENGEVESDNQSGGEESSDEEKGSQSQSQSESDDDTNTIVSPERPSLVVSPQHSKIIASIEGREDTKREKEAMAVGTSKKKNSQMLVFEKLLQEQATQAALKEQHRRDMLRELRLTYHSIGSVEAFRRLLYENEDKEKGQMQQLYLRQLKEMSVQKSEVLGKVRVEKQRCQKVGKPPA
jgi:hypothetical protein